MTIEQPADPASGRDQSRVVAVVTRVSVLDGGRIADGAVFVSYARPVTDTTATNGKAGVSARREGERRKAKREAGIRARHPRIGGVILALQDAPQHERSWARGAGGEELVEQALSKRCSDIPVLHDRRIPGSRANIDHIAIAASGVWVIDTKRYRGKIQVAKPLFGTRTLRIAGRDQTKLVDGLAKQEALVMAAAADVGLNIQVEGCFCFVDSELPLFGTPTINGLSIFGRRGMANQLNAPGGLTADDVLTVAAAMGERFPAA
jgi:hypothetical protein